MSRNNDGNQSSSPIIKNDSVLLDTALLVSVLALVVGTAYVGFTYGVLLGFIFMMLSSCGISFLLINLDGLEKRNLSRKIEINYPKVSKELRRQYDECHLEIKSEDFLSHLKKAVKIHKEERHFKLAKKYLMKNVYDVSPEEKQNIADAYHPANDVDSILDGLGYKKEVYREFVGYEVVSQESRD